MMKKYALLIAAILLLMACNNKGNKNAEQADSVKREAIDKPEEIQQISEIISRFARAYLSQDNDKINALINPDFGIAIIYRPGASDVYTVVDSIDFKNPIPASYDYPTFQNDQVLSFAALPTYDCGKEKWDKLGFFCDTTATSQTHILTTIAKFVNEFENVPYDDAVKQQINALEGGSYRVILAQGQDSLIFHVKQFGTAWYVTLLDRAYGGCDA